MDFGLSQDQKLLDESVRGFLQSRVPIERVRELRDLDCPNDRTIWKGLAELGASGVLIREEQGGSGLGLLDAALVAQALGHSATPAPFLSSAVMAAVTLGALQGDLVEGWLRGIASGDLVVSVAVTETFSVRESAGVDLRDGVLHGKAMMAIDAHRSDLVLIAIDRDRIAAIPSDAAGLTITPLATIDRTRCLSELLLDAARPHVVFQHAGEALARSLDAGRIALAADTIGACESMIERAVAYAKERRQFGRVIGSFQAVKHMCAEMVAALEPARSLLWHAAHTFDAQPDEAPLMSCHVLAHAAEIGREIASTSTQVHGGTGWTDEQNLHFWFKRIGVARHLLGGPEYLRGRAASLQELEAGA